MKIKYFVVNTSLKIKWWIIGIKKLDNHIKNMWIMLLTVWRLIFKSKEWYLNEMLLILLNHHLSIDKDLKLITKNKDFVKLHSCKTLSAQCCIDGWIYSITTLFFHLL